MVRSTVTASPAGELSAEATTCFCNSGGTRSANASAKVRAAEGNRHVPREEPQPGAECQRTEPLRQAEINFADPEEHLERADLSPQGQGPAEADWNARRPVRHHQNCAARRERCRTRSVDGEMARQRPYNPRSDLS